MSEQPQCKTGSKEKGRHQRANRCCLDAMFDWAMRRESHRSTAATKDWIATLPAPPVYGTEDYVSCMDEWMDAYADAQAMNAREQTIQRVQMQLDYATKATWLDPRYRAAWIAALQNDLAELNAQQSQAEVALAAQVAAYTNCVNGTPV